MGFFKQDYVARTYEVTVKFRFSDTRGIPYSMSLLTYLLDKSLGYESPIDREYSISTDKFDVEVEQVIRTR